mgnify:FL=1
MWIDSKFLIQVTHVLDKLNKGGDVDIDNIALEYPSAKYKDILELLLKLQKKQKKQNTFMGHISLKIKQLSKGIFYEKEEGDEEGVSKLFSHLSRTLLSITRDSSRVNKAASEGILDTRINEKLYLGDFEKMASGINQTIDATVKTLRDVSDSLKRFSSGDFQAQIKTQYEGDYKRLQLAVNSLGHSLNSLIEDSYKMSESTKEGTLGARINLSKYKGDFINIAKSINDTMDKNERDQWIQSGIVGLNEILLGDNDIAATSSKTISYLGYYLNAGVGALYVYDSSEEVLSLHASYAYVQRENLSNKFKLGEGTVGQVALQKSPILLKNIQRSQLTIDTGTSSEPPLNTYTYPLLYKDEIYGVIELGSNEVFNAKILEFFEATNGIIATALYSAIANKKVKVLLNESRVQNENIQKTNVEMEEQQQQLEEANSQMAEQQQQLEEANSQMQEQQQQLKESNSQMEEQQVLLKEKNLVLEQSKFDLDKRAEDLALSSKYKSEFLANMSHELRTPLNSIILLSEMIHEDKFGHLDKEEIKKASIIHNSGNELLRLINDVLDLSKVEAGMLEVIVDEFDSSTFLDEIFVQFEHQAIEKNLELMVNDTYKGTLISDKHRLSQILRNLISNSLKFTKEGSICIDLKTNEEDKIQIQVRDTGIGIPSDKLRSIFEAFQQAEGGTSREYGGTGLGLSISRELSQILGGNISVSSELEKGSTFTIVIPNLKKDKKEGKTEAVVEAKVKISEFIDRQEAQKSDLADDSDIITAADKPFLIIEDDEQFASILRDRINEKNEYVLISTTGQEGINLAKEYDVKGVLLDLGLPDMNGIDVLKEFKTNLNLRKIPVYIISGTEKDILSHENGAIGYSQKPLQKNDIIEVIEKINTFNDKTVKDLLIVEDDENQREALLEYIGNGTVKSKGVDSKIVAIKEIDKGIYDGIVIDLGLKDGSGYDICEYIYENNLDIPIIIYTGKELSKEEEIKLRKYTDTIVIKTVSSQKRLLDEVDIFMHRVKVGKKGKAQNVTSISLKEKKVLIVDDDIRNIYVLSQALSSKGAKILTADNGRVAIEVLNENDDIDIILMDIMMPIMDGYEATKIIKSNLKTQHIPVIAVTAKAMDHDKQKTLDAGCDDFISKPLKMDILLGIVKSWLE